MAKTYDIGLKPVTFTADVDLADHLYYVVTSTASHADYVELGSAGCDPAPIGVIQDDTASAQGDPVPVAMFGPTKVWAAACDVGGEACPIQNGDLLTCGSNAMLYRAGSAGMYCARALGALSTGSGIINVFFLGSLVSLGAGAS